MKANLPAVLRDFDQMERAGYSYKLGGKLSMKVAPGAHKPRRVDCSGLMDYLLSRNGLDVPDGSQNQLAFFERLAKEGKVHELAQYSDVTYGDPGRLFIAFIKVNTNGAGKIGHVWLVHKDDDGSVETMESHGGVGVNSRPWNHGPLKRMVYKTFEVPTK